MNPMRMNLGKKMKGKTIVVYTSKYGAAKQYAEWLAEDLSCDIFEAKSIKKSDLENYDNIVYGGGVHAGGIEGWDSFRKIIKKYLDIPYFNAIDKEGNFVQENYHPLKKICCFAVGINVQNFEGRAELRNVNFDKRYLRPVTCFYLDGRYNPQEIKGADGLLMKYVRKLLNDKGLNMTPEEKELLKRIDEGCDLIDRSQIEQIKNFI